MGEEGQDRFAGLRQEVIKYLVIALIATGLVSGVKYLLFDSEIEIAEVST